MRPARGPFRGFCFPADAPLPRRPVAQHPKLRGRKIDGLRDSLVKILSDFNLQKELLKGCTDILTTDVVGLLQKLSRQQKRAIAFKPEETFCEQCQSSLTSIGRLGWDEAGAALRDPLLPSCGAALDLNSAPP